MTRAAFNTTADIFCGPGSPTPGVLKATLSCRFVIEDGVFLDGAGAPNRVAYLTHDSAAMTGAFIPAYFGADARLADQVAVPSGSAVAWWILFEEEITWLAQPTYWRSNLVELPLPEAPPPCACPAECRIIIGCEIPNTVYTQVTIGAPPSPAESRVLIGASVVAAGESLVIIGIDQGGGGLVELGGVDAGGGGLVELGGVDAGGGGLVELGGVGAGGGGLVELGGVDAGGARVDIGSSISSGPGTTCEDALEVSSGSIYVETRSETVSQWYKFECSADTEYHIRITTSPSDYSAGTSFAGSNCGDLTADHNFSSESPCYSFTIESGGTVWLEMPPGEYIFDYVVEFDEGPC